MSDLLRQSAEDIFAEELDFLIKNEKNPIPDGWSMSPKSVLLYICGGKVGSKTISSKFIGHKRLIEISIATLLTDRSLLLVGEPGTAKSWLSEHLAAAISGDSEKIIQGTAGTTEEHIRYSWNYAMLIANGPSEEALVKSPLCKAMEEGAILRFEEITRCAPEIQDALISILSEKNLAIPDLGKQIAAKRGFSVIATANTRDKGVNDMSAALKRRFNVVSLPAPVDLPTELKIVKQRLTETAKSLSIQAKLPSEEDVTKVLTVFRELRQGNTLDGKSKLKIPSGVLSTAEAISLLTGAMAMAGSFGNGEVTGEHLANGLHGVVLKDEQKDKVVWEDYLEHVVKKRGADWRPIYEASRQLL
ncbi:MAG: AAA family ATPase [Lentisphaeraceae bacterium]|nr:AAA family ATPase [Lentisphaeraceae bacterium]